MSKQLYFFNPGHETAMLNGSPYYTAPANVVKMQKDLAYLPAWLASADDYVLLNNQLPQSYTEHISLHNLSIGQPIIIDNIQSIEHLTKVHIWGEAPQALHYFEELNFQYNLNLEIPIWNNKITELSSRNTARECLIYLTKKLPEIQEYIIPEFYSDLNELETTVSKSSCKYLVKAPFSSSGRGLVWLPVQQITRTERQILHGIIKKQGSATLERALDKKLDFAMEFILSEDGDISFEGYSLFKTNSKGGYLGNYLDSQLNILEKINRFVSKELLENVRFYIVQFLQSTFRNIYSGCIGVDMLIYEESGLFHLHPCVEINVRDNMGLLAIKISEKYLHHSSSGFFSTDFNSKNGEAKRLDEENSKSYPIHSVKGRIKSGYLSLCPVDEDTKYRAYIHVQ